MATFSYTEPAAALSGDMSAEEKQRTKGKISGSPSLEADFPTVPSSRCWCALYPSQPPVVAAAFPALYSASFCHGVHPLLFLFHAVLQKLHSLPGSSGTAYRASP